MKKDRNHDVWQLKELSIFVLLIIYITILILSAQHVLCTFAL